MPAGSASPVLAASSVTSAPRAAAVLASAYPCRPDDQFPIKRTGSSSSRVPPAEITTRRPARSGTSEADLLASTRSATWKSSAGSGSLPGPESLPVSRPEAGSSTRAPRPRSVATLACVAGCCHISVCMAGA